MIILSKPTLFYFNTFLSILFLFLQPPSPSIAFPFHLYPNLALLFRAFFYFSLSLLPLFVLSFLWSASCQSRATVPSLPEFLLQEWKQLRQQLLPRKHAEQDEMELMRRKALSSSLHPHKHYLWKKQGRDLTHRETGGVLNHWSRPKSNDLPELASPVQFRTQRTLPLFI